MVSGILNVSKQMNPNGTIGPTCRFIITTLQVGDISLIFSHRLYVYLWDIKYRLRFPEFNWNPKDLSPISNRTLTVVLRTGMY